MGKGLVTGVLFCFFINHFFINAVFSDKSTSYRKKTFSLLMKWAQHLLPTLDNVSFTFFLPFTRYTPMFNRDNRISDIIRFLSKAKQFGSVCCSNSIHVQGKSSLAELLSGSK